MRLFALDVEIDQTGNLKQCWISKWLLMMQSKICSLTLLVGLILIKNYIFHVDNQWKVNVMCVIYDSKYLSCLQEEPDRHDWYCFECHKGGEVVCCSKCYRVYHEMCINVEDHLYDSEPLVCVVCKVRLYKYHFYSLLIGNINSVPFMNRNGYTVRRHYWECDLPLQGIVQTVYKLEDITVNCVF